MKSPQYANTTVATCARLVRWRVVSFTARQCLKVVQFIYAQEPRGSVRASVCCVFHNFSSAAAANALVKQRHACPCALEARVGGADQRKCVGFEGGKK